MQIPSFVIPVGVAILFLVAGFFMVMGTISRYYKKISPNTVAVITGRKNKIKMMIDGEERVVEKGYRFVSGGGALIVPLLEKMEEMSLNTISTTVTVTDVPSKEGVKVTVVAIANVKIQSDEASLPLAIERFLGSSEAQIRGVIDSTLEGDLRGIVGTMTVEGLVNDRQTFTQHVLEEAGTDLAKMGLSVDVVKIQSISDEHGYIDALGKKRTAGVVRDASIGEAEAQQETDVKTAAARQTGATAQAVAEQAISTANRDRDMAIADNEAQVKAQQAQIPIAAEIAAANRTKELNVATVDAKKAEITAGIALQQEEAKRVAAEQQATVVVPAEKAKEARIIAADAGQAAAEREGEAFRIKASKEGEGERAKQEGVAAGRKALASADQAEREALAAGNKAQLLATAAGVQADLEAKAAGEMAMANAIRARLLAEAEGTEKRAEAFAKLDQAGRFLMILEALPPVIAACGEAGERIVRPAAEAIGTGLGNVKEIRIVDLGGGKDGGQSLVSRFASTPVQAFFGLFEQAKAAGFGPLIDELTKRFGINLDEIIPSVAPAAAEPPIEGEAKTVTPAEAKA